MILKNFLDWFLFFLPKGQEHKAPSPDDFVAPVYGDRHKIEEPPTEEL